MSTQPQLSPLEQLGQDVQKPAQSTTPSQPQLSPLELLGQDVQKTQTAGQTAKQNAKDNPEQYASDTRQMLVSGLTGMPTPNMTEQDRSSFESGKAAGAGTATLLSAAPLLGALAPHLPDLNKAWKIAALLGGSSATVDHLLHVLGVLNGKHK